MIVPTGISRYFISVIRIVIQFGHIAIFSNLFIVAIETQFTNRNKSNKMP